MHRYYIINNKTIVVHQKFHLRFGESFSSLISRILDIAETVGKADPFTKGTAKNDMEGTFWQCFFELEPKSPAPIIDGDSLKERLVSSGNFTTSDAELFLDDMVADGKIVEVMSNKFRDSCQKG